MFPAIAYTLAMIGELRLVPPTTSHPSKPNVSYTASPVCGSATAATSATVRRSQSRSFCQPGLWMYAEQPLVEPAHAVSVQPRALPSRTSVVPPTEVTNCDEPG